METFHSSLELVVLFIYFISPSLRQVWILINENNWSSNWPIKPTEVQVKCVRWTLMIKQTFSWSQMNDDIIFYTLKIIMLKLNFMEVCCIRRWDNDRVTSLSWAGVEFGLRLIWFLFLLSFLSFYTLWRQMMAKILGITHIMPGNSINFSILQKWRVTRQSHIPSPLPWNPASKTLNHILNTWNRLLIMSTLFQC